MAVKSLRFKVQVPASVVAAVLVKTLDETDTFKFTSTGDEGGLKLKPKDRLKFPDARQKTV